MLRLQMGSSEYRRNGKQQQVELHFIICNVQPSECLLARWVYKLASWSFVFNLQIKLEFVWVIRNGNSELLRLNMTSHKDMKCRASHVIMPPRNSDVIMATCCREVLWVLTSEYRVYARTGISGISPQVCTLALHTYS